MSGTIMDEIRSRKVFFDGGMGSLLQARGLKAGELPETWNLLRPEVLRMRYPYYQHLWGQWAEIPARGTIFLRRDH